MPAQCRDKQSPAGRPRKLRHTCPERVTSEIRDRRFGAELPRSPAGQRPAELQREQWIPLRRVEEPPELSWRHGQAEALLPAACASHVRAQRPHLRRVPQRRAQRRLHPGNRSGPSGTAGTGIAGPGPGEQRMPAPRRSRRRATASHPPRPAAGSWPPASAGRSRTRRRSRTVLVPRPGLGPQQRRFQRPPLRTPADRVTDPISIPSASRKAPRTKAQPPPRSALLPAREYPVTAASRRPCSHRLFCRCPARRSAAARVRECPGR